MPIDTTLKELIINKMTYEQAKQNVSQIGEKELILTTNKVLPIPTTQDEGKSVVVRDGDYALEKVHLRKIKRLSNVAISTIFNDIQLDSVLSVKIRFRADANLKGISFDQIISSSGQTIANYSASDSALIATANEVLVLYKSYNYESNYEFSVGNYKLSITNGAIPILSYYGIQHRTDSNGIHWIFADSTTDFKVDAEIEIEN